MVVMASDSPSLISSSLRLGLAANQPSNATTPSPSWAPHIMISEHLIFSNFSELRLFPATCSMKKMGKDGKSFFDFAHS